MRHFWSEERGLNETKRRSQSSLLNRDIPILRQDRGTRNGRQCLGSRCIDGGSVVSGHGQAFTRSSHQLLERARSSALLLVRRSAVQLSTSPTPGELSDVRCALPVACAPWMARSRAGISWGHTTAAAGSSSDRASDGTGWSRLGSGSGWRRSMEAAGGDGEQHAIMGLQARRPCPALPCQSVPAFVEKPSTLDGPVPTHARPLTFNSSFEPRLPGSAGERHARHSSRPRLLYSSTKAAARSTGVLLKQCVGCVACTSSVV